MHSEIQSLELINGFRRIQIKLQDDIGDLEDLQRKQVERTEDLHDGQTSISMQLDGITEGLQTSITESSLAKSAINMVAQNQGQDSKKLDSVVSSLCELRFYERDISIQQILQTSVVDTLTRVVRAELRGSVIPHIQREFRASGAKIDRSLEKACQSIDSLSGELGSMIDASQEKSLGFSTGQGNVAHPQEPSKPKDGLQGLQDSITTSSSHPRRKRDTIQRYRWLLNLPFGVVSVTVTISTRKKAQTPAHAYPIQKQPFSREYRFNITYIPSQSLLSLKGVDMLYKVKQDHLSTYPEICPTITFINVVPSDSEIFHYAVANDVESLKRLFAERRASPHDRDPFGQTALFVRCSCLKAMV